MQKAFEKSMIEPYRALLCLIPHSGELISDIPHLLQIVAMLQAALETAFSQGILDYDLDCDVQMNKWTTYLKAEEKKFAVQRAQERQAELARAAEAQEKAHQAMLAINAAAESNDQWLTAARAALAASAKAWHLVWKDSVAKLLQSAKGILDTGKSRVGVLEDLPWLKYTASLPANADLPTSWLTTLQSCSATIVCDTASLASEVLPTKLPGPLEAVLRAQQDAWDCITVLAACLICHCLGIVETCHDTFHLLMFAHIYNAKICKDMKGETTASLYVSLFLSNKMFQA